MRRNKKSKMTMLVVGGLAAVSLVSVGFANWVLVGTQGKESNITVTAGEVEDRSLITTIYTEDQGSDLTLSFDNAKDGGTNNVFDSSSTGTEDLSFAIKFKIEGGVSNNLSTVEFTFDTGIAGTTEKPNPLSDLTNTNEAVDYLSYPWLSGVSGARKVIFTCSVDSETPTLSYTSGGNSGGTTGVTPTIIVDTANSNSTSIVATATFTFKWGKAFNYVNPSKTVLNSDNYTAENIISRVRKFNTAFKNATTGNNYLKVTVTPTAKS